MLIYRVEINQSLHSVIKYLSLFLTTYFQATPKGKLKPVKEATEPEDSKEARATKVLQEAKKFGVNMNPPITADQLVQVK